MEVYPDTMLFFLVNFQVNVYRMQVRKKRKDTMIFLLLWNC